MDSLALGHNFGAYEDAQNQQQQQQQQQFPDYNRQQQEYYNQNLRLINSERIEFAATMKAIGKFLFYMGLTGSLIFISRILPIFSFAGFLVRVLTFCLLAKEAVFNPSDKDRRDFQIMLTAVGLGNIGAEWDAWLSISLAISDFFALYGMVIFAGMSISVVIVVLILLRNGGSNEVNTLNTTNVYTDEYNTEEQQNDY